MAKGKYQEWLTPDNLLRLSAWARDGLTDEDIAKKININVSTLYEWKNKYPEINEALKNGKEIADIAVENALYKRAVGYTYIEQTKELQTVIDPDTGEKTQKLVVTKEVTKEVMPDTTAQIYWLSNRQNAKWRRNPDADVDNKEPIKIQLMGDIAELAE